MSYSDNILVIGALGQVGTELTVALEASYGSNHVIASDIALSDSDLRDSANHSLAFQARYVYLDCTDASALHHLVKKEKITIIYHLAAMLSAKAEQQPEIAWQLNINGLRNVLDVARSEGCQVFVPSSIAAFGASTPKDGTPQLTIQRPSTIYGISKVAGELLCDYYVQRYSLDIRGLRYPGLISTAAPPGGGTTDYSIAMLQAAARAESYICPLAPDASMDMMYMPDAIKATLELMQADPHRLKHRNAYNVTAFSFNPQQLAEVIYSFEPNFTLSYEVNPQLTAIAASWPNSLDDSAARADWGWQPAYTLAAMVADALKKFAHNTISDNLCNKLSRKDGVETATNSDENGIKAERLYEVCFRNWYK